jgi:lactate dehydrogenase-like 2-hydroxyacid dehydrogenase
MKPRLIVSRQMPQSVGDRIRAEFDCPYPDGTDMDVPTTLRLLTETRADALLFTSHLKLNAEVIAALPDHVKVAATCSVGFDHIDVPAARARGLPVTNTPEVLNECTADLAFMLLLNACRRGHEYEAVMRAGWRRGMGMGEMLGVRAWGKTLGILGMGGIGRAMAARARGFGMKIVYCNRTRLKPELELGATWFPDFEEMLPHCDILSLHAPSGPETTGIMNARTFGLLPKGAVFVNAARGALVDESALIEALTSGQLFGAGLDVFHNEPAYDLRFSELPNVFLTPHMGSATAETRRAMGFKALDNIQAVLAGKPPIDPLWS